MKIIFNVLCALIFFFSMGCSPVKNEGFSPSIASLKLNETLVMKLQACHWGCTEGTVKFRGGKAIVGRHSLKLTTKEIESLDIYFLLGKSREESGRCSLPIEISFKHKKGLRVLSSKDVEIYPCFFRGQLGPIALVEHFNETATETPYWRLSPEEQNKKNSLIEFSKN